MIEELGHGYWHEALDRAYLVQEMLGEHVIDHPVIAQNADLKELALAAEDALMALYQAIGRKMPDFECTVKGGEK